SPSPTSAPNSGLDTGLQDHPEGEGQEDQEDQEKAQNVPDYLASSEQNEVRQTTPRPPLDGEETERVGAGRQEEEDTPKMDDIIQDLEEKERNAEMPQEQEGYTEDSREDSGQFGGDEEVEETRGRQPAPPQTYRAPGGRGRAGRDPSPGKPVRPGR
ncbi:hypothetical protein EGW08_005795, partial [Elysia chlorotica]